MNNKTSAEFKSWLDKMQQDSWQLELLISGFAIFGLVGAYPALRSLYAHVFLQPDDIMGFFFVLGVLLLNAAWVVFTVNLIIHVFLRGLWIGALGLRYVSGDIDYKSLDYSTKFQNRYIKKIPSFDDYIERLERYTSVMFAYTFLLFFIFLSVIAFWCFLVGFLLFSVILLGGEVIDGTGFGFHLEINSIQTVLILILAVAILVFGLIVSIDFLTLGWFKKIKNRFFAAIYYPINRFISFISLSFLWRPLLLNFLDQKFTRILVFSAIPYGFIIAFLVPNITLVNNQFYPKLEDEKTEYLANSFHYKYYDDERMNRMGEEIISSGLMSLPSKFVKNRWLEVFVRNNKEDDQLIMLKDSSIYPLQMKGIRTVFSGDDIIEHQDKSFRKKLFDEQLRMFEDSWKNDGLEDSQIEEKRAKMISRFGEQEAIYDGDNVKKLKDLRTKLFRFKLNQQLVNPKEVVCHFYQHPILSENGMICHFSIDSLKSGIHYLTLERDIYNDRLDTTFVTIPFIFDKRY